MVLEAFMDRPLETRDTETEAWELAGEYRDAARGLGMTRFIGVRPIAVWDNEKHMKVTNYEVYVSGDGA